MILFVSGLALAGGAAVTHGMFERNSPVFGQVRSHITAMDAVALTFDDGPHPETTPRVLDALAKSDLHATFFVLGRYAARWPALVERAYAEGHEVANHGFTHRKLHLRSPSWIREDIRLGAEAISAATGESPRWFMTGWRISRAFSPWGRRSR